MGALADIEVARDLTGPEPDSTPELDGTAEGTGDSVGQHLAVAEGLVLLAAEIVRLLPRDVSLTTASAVMALKRSGPRRLTDLATSEGVTQPSMTDLVTRLERDGLAERRRDPADRRVVWVSLTPAGEEFVCNRYQGAALRLAELVKDLPAREADALAAALPALAHLRQLEVPCAGGIGRGVTDGGLRD